MLQDGLFYEFSRYSNSVTVRLYGDSEKKWAMIKYKRCGVKMPPLLIHVRVFHYLICAELTSVEKHLHNHKA